MKFSIVCLTYKRINLLEESVFSVLQQTYKNYELLIINDFYLQKIKFDHPQVKIFNLNIKFNSLGEKRNFGVEQSTGDLILQLDDDDFILPTYLENLNNLIGDSDFLFPQKPIMYYNDEKKIFLSPHPLANTFLYKRLSIGKNYHYDPINFDEITPFYIKVKNSKKTTCKMAMLKPEQCGYVYRQDIDLDKKYSMGRFKKESINEQNIILNSINDKPGEIYLNPSWKKDYVSIIKNNCKFPKKSGISQIEMVLKEKEKQIKSVKISWENALKFVESANSRGILSTTADLLKLNGTGGEKVSDEILQQRKLSCFGNEEKNINACENLRNVVNKGYFCNSCGCGTNNLARLDGDGYTKLHYPYLECPLKRPGFSNSIKSEENEKPPISIIIPVLNDNEELNLTIKSIYETSPENIEIIAIDDSSDLPATVSDKRVKLFRFNERKGAGQARHFGALNATSKHLLFIDSHMRFDPKWFDNAMKRIINNPKTLWCGACLGLDSSNMDITKSKGVYTGADLVLYREKNKTIFDGVWRKEIKNQDDYEISCVMGACYFIHKDWYFYIKGLGQTTMWGSEEPILSTKTWLAGGEVRIMKSVRLGHKFRSSAPYSTTVSDIHYNKLAYMYMIFPSDLFEKMKLKFNQDGNFKEAMNFVNKNKDVLDKEKEYYKTIFKHDIYWLCDKFKIEVPK